MVRLPHLLTPRTEMSRRLPKVVFESFLQPPSPGQGLTVHSLTELSGGTAADRAQMVDALTIADPGLRTLDGPSDVWRVHVHYRLGDMPTEVQAVFRFAGTHWMPTVWARLERGATALRMLVPAGTDPAALADQLHSFLAAHAPADADIRVEAGPSEAELLRLRLMEATLAQVRGPGR